MCLRLGCVPTRPSLPTAPATADLIGTDAYIEPSRLQLLKALGEGAFAKVQHARLSGEDGAGGGGGGAPREVAVKTLRQASLRWLQPPVGAWGGCSASVCVHERSRACHRAAASRWHTSLPSVFSP